MIASFDMCRSTLIDTVEKIVVQSGNSANFDAASWVDQWVTELLPALGETPWDHIQAGKDCELLARLLLQAQSGSYG